MDSTLIASKITAGLEGIEYPTPEDVERLMRPIGHMTSQTWREVENILREQGLLNRALRIQSWVEAQVVTSNDPDVELRILLLLMDTCTCVLDHLPKAIEHAKGPVDPRILELLHHPYFQKK